MGFEPMFEDYKSTVLDQTILSDQLNRRVGFIPTLPNITPTILLPLHRLNNIAPII